MILGILTLRCGVGLRSVKTLFWLTLLPEWREDLLTVDTASDNLGLEVSRVFGTASGWGEHEMRRTRSRSIRAFSILCTNEFTDVCLILSVVYLLWEVDLSFLDTFRLDLLKSGLKEHSRFSLT